MGGTHRDAEPADFRVLQQIATVCEQSATDCNKGTAENGSQTAQNPVVEHKVGGRLGCVLFVRRRLQAT